MIKGIMVEMTTNRQKYIINQKDFDQDKDCCLICMQVPNKPQQCLQCKSTFCDTCSLSWKNIHNECPKKCSKKWALQPKTKKRYYLRCPFSEHCMFAVPWENWENHVFTCEFMPESVKYAVDSRKSGTCKNSHALTAECEFKKCDECGEKQICLLTCGACKLHYCKKCRLPKFTPKVCPNKHNIVSSDKMTFQCDRCFRGFVDRACYEDKTCKTKICELCQESEKSGGTMYASRVRIISGGIKI